jgi:hypothetical protein
MARMKSSPRGLVSCFFGGIASSPIAQLNEHPQYPIYIIPSTPTSSTTNSSCNFQWCALSRAPAAPFQVFGCIASSPPRTIEQSPPVPHPPYPQHSNILHNQLQVQFATARTKSSPGGSISSFGRGIASSPPHAIERTPSTSHLSCTH